MTSNSKPPKTETGKTLAKMLSARGLTQYGVAASSETLSQPYLNQVVKGHRTPSASWLDLVADVMELDDKERQKLHRAGAKDQGFKIDLD